MTPVELAEAVRICLQGSNPQGLVDAELGQFFGAELEALIPADGVVGVAASDDGPVILGLGDSDLIVSRPSRGPDGELKFNSTMLPLRPTPRIELVSTVSVDRRKKNRFWTLLSARGDAVELSTAEVIHAELRSDIRPDSGERVLRTLAERLSEGEGKT